MMAGKMKVESCGSSTTFTGMARARAAAETARVDRALIGRRDHRDGAVKIGSGESPAAMGELARERVLGRDRH